MLFMNNITKKINKLFNWIYTLNGYYCLKSGLFVDSAFKFIFNKLNKNLHFFYGLVFADLFLINRFLNSLFYNWSRFNSKIFDLKKNNNFYGIKQTVLLILLFILMFIFVIV